MTDREPMPFSCRITPRTAAAKALIMDGLTEENNLSCYMESI